MKKNYFTLIFIFIGLHLFTTNVKAQCSANFTYTNTGNTYHFTDASTTSSGTILSRTWNFGDFTAPSTATNPSHTYTMCGVYTVSLTIVTSTFCTNTYNTSITVNGGIAASFTANVDTTNGNTTFQASPLSLAATYTWDYGDGSATGSNAVSTHTYASSGTYNVCLTVADTGGLCTTTICNNVIVYITPPTCNSTFTSTGAAGNMIFTAAPFNLNYTYSWDYGDGSPNGTGFISNHTYTLPGTYNVCLTTYDSSTTCTSSYCNNVTVTIDTTCIPSFTYIDANGNVVFNPSPLNALNTYSWNYGDGGTGNIALGAHTYAASGTYNVCLTMTNQLGCTGTFCMPVTVTIVGIQEQTAENFNLNIFPNPANGSVNLSFNLIKPSEVSIELYDILGSKYYTESQSKNSGINTTSIDLSNYNTGVYFIKLSTEDLIISKMIIKK